MQLLSGYNLRSYEIGFQAGNFLITLLWWNIFIKLFIWLQFNVKESLNFSEGATEVVLALHNDFLTAILIVSGFVALLWIVDHYVINRLRIIFSLLVITILQFLSFLFVFSVTAVLFGLYHCSIPKELVANDAIQCIRMFVFNHTMLLFFVAGLIINFSLEFLFEVQKSFGFKVFWKFIFGHYRKPKEENRIFLFLDLVSSTETAIQLGHVKYSEFLQDCFYTLGDAIVRTKGSVYQYIGDEAVISWNANKKSNFVRAAEFIYQFKKDIDRRKKYFEKKYNLVPQFTASLNSGKIMVAQVGATKKEIAYHGSVLNTAARLQKQCKVYGSSLLATENFVSKLKGQNPDYKCEQLAEVQFEGKQEIDRIFRVDKQKQN